MKRRTVHIHVDFRRDLRGQLSWLAEHRDADYIARLRDGISDLRALLADLPRAGPPVAIDGEITLRKILLRDLPYVVWFADDEARSEVWLMRLFHARQSQPMPVVGRWPR